MTYFDVNLTQLSSLTAGKFIYCVAEDGIMYAFDVKGGQLESVLTVSEGTVVSVSHHPHRNLIATISDHGKVKLWRP